MKPSHVMGHPGGAGIKNHCFPLHCPSPMLINEQMARKQHRHKPFSPSPTPRAETMPALPSCRALAPCCRVTAGRARGHTAWPWSGMARMAPRSGSLDISGQPQFPWPSDSCLWGRADINHPPREGTEAPSGAI